MIEPRLATLRFLLIGVIMTVVIEALAGDLTLTSIDMGEQIKLAQVFDRYGCHGRNLSPQLAWHGEPKNTKSFAITMYDPDAPTDHGWWHWIAVNIPADVHRIPTGASPGTMPEGTTEIVNDYGIAAYGGPCPPKGDKPHRYVLTLYALDTPHLPLKGNTPIPVAIRFIRAHTIAKMSLKAYYGR